MPPRLHSSLRAWRLAEGKRQNLGRPLSQAEAAALLRITQSKWSRIECGLTMPSLLLAQRITATTGVPQTRLVAIALAGRRRRRRRQLPPVPVTASSSRGVRP